MTLSVALSANVQAKKQIKSDAKKRRAEAAAATAAAAAPAGPAPVASTSSSGGGEPSGRQREPSVSSVQSSEDGRRRRRLDTPEQVSAAAAAAAARTGPVAAPDPHWPPSGTAPGFGCWRWHGWRVQGALSVLSSGTVDSSEAHRRHMKRQCSITSPFAGGPGVTVTLKSLPGINL